MLRLAAVALFAVLQSACYCGNGGEVCTGHATVLLTGPLDGGLTQEDCQRLCKVTLPSCSVNDGGTTVDCAFRTCGV